jgi:DNA-binding CsgD family transcriptional regulator
MYRKQYKSDVGDNYSHRQVQISTSALKDQNETMALSSHLTSDIARIEAKIDILLNLAYGGGQNKNVTASNETTISPAELSLLRSMTAKQHVTSQLLIEGWSNKDIAHVLGIGENTVKLHVRAVCKKVGTKTRGQAALVLRDIFMSVDPSEYQRSSGGLPVDWAATYIMDIKDPYEKIYRKE